MILVMRSDATENDITRVSERIKELGFKPHLSKKGVERTVIGAIGHEFPELQGMLDDVFPILKPYKLARLPTRRHYDNCGWRHPEKR